nr:hypothetical protein [Tanacetum cinerariifolium]
MANENVPSLALTISDDQIRPFAAWLPIGKSNFVLDLQKKQKNLIFQIFVDILQNTNFFRAFTASLDEDWFRMDANLLREALEIIHVDQAHQFVSPPLGDAIMDFVNQLGYPGEIHFVSRMEAQISSLLNAVSPTKKGKKTKPHVIPYSRFTKIIIYYLGRHHNIHQRSGSPLNLAEDDLSLGNLKFVPKGEMVAKHEQRIAAEKEGGKKKTAPKADKPMKPAPAKQAKPATAKQPKLKPTVVLDEGQSGSDPGKTLESRTLPDDDKMDEDQAESDPVKSHVALSGLNPKPMHDDFVATVYTKPTTFPLPESFTVVTTKTTTTTLSLPPPPQQQSIIDSELAAFITALEKKFSDFEQKIQTLDNATQNLGSRVFTMELQDLPHKINQTVNKVVKEAVHIALQASLRDRFRELPKADMNQILHQRMDGFLVKKDMSRNRHHNDQDPPPPLPDLDLSKKKRHDSDASRSKHPPASQSST